MESGRQTPGLNNRERFLVNLSMFGGLAIGILGNLLVTSTFRWIDNKNTDTTIGYIFAWIVFLGVSYVLYRRLIVLYRTM